ncbi:MAG TPA: hypothetical protein VJM33_04120, partial [Microthrixaceae bacterium]|nr:hypothetical protein [Microthrixaceae bacterium]
DAGSRRVLWGSILGAAMAVWAGFALRYAAIAMIPAGGLALLVPFRRTGAKAVIGRAAAFGVLASIGPALVMLRNHGINGSLMGPRSESPDGLVTTVQRFVATLGRWVVPDPAPVGLQGVAGAALVAGFGALIAWAVWDPTRRASVFPPAVEGEVAPDSLSPLTCFVGVYAAYLVAAQITTAFDPIGTRLMSPMFVPLVVLCTALLERSWGLIGSARRPRLAFAAIGALVVLFVGHAVVFVVEARDANVEGVEYASRSWRDSEFVAAVGRVPADADLYSNVPAGVWAVHRREPLWKSPEKSLRRARQAVEMDPAFLRTVTCRPVYLAWSDEAVGDYLFTPEELRDHVELEEVEAVDDGAIYRVRPLTDGTAQSAGC